MPTKTDIITNLTEHGWKVAAPIWRESDADRSKKVKYPLSDTSHLLLYVIDRDRPNGETELGLHAWWVEDDGITLREFGLDDGLPAVADVDAAALADILVTVANTCPHCGRNVGVDELVRVGFAARSCPQCAPSANAALPPRWWM